MNVPEMRLLGYQATRPRLRVLNLPNEDVQPSPVPLNGGTAAIDRARVRDGWIVFDTGEELWSVRTPLTGKARRIRGFRSFCPARNPRNVWLARAFAPGVHGVDRLRGPLTMVEYDGVEDRVIRELQLPEWMRVVGELPDGLLLSNAQSLALLAWSDGTITELIEHRQLLALHQTRLVLAPDRSDSDSLMIIDTANGISIDVAAPSGGWGMWGTLSPDGGTFVIAVVDWITQLTTGSLTGSRLAIIDTATGNLRLAEGRFENFATPAVWSHDSAWVIFDAPFDKSLFICHTTDSEPALVPILRRRGRPSPLVNITGIS